MNINYITVSGGELLGCKEVFDMIEYIKDRNINIMLTINGILIDETVVKKLKDLKIV